MTEEEKNLALQEEQKADDEALKSTEVQEDELRAEIAEEFGLDAEQDATMLDKFVEREKNNREKLSGAIKQKIKWRTRAETKFDDKDDDKSKGKKPLDNSDDKESVEERIRREFEERDLKALDLPEEVEAQVKTLSKLKGISVREAAEDPIIVGIIANLDKDERVTSSSPKRSKRGVRVSTGDASVAPDPDNFDFNSMDGVKAWREAKRKHKEYLEQSS